MPHFYPDIWWGLNFNVQKLQEHPEESDVMLDCTGDLGKLEPGDPSMHQTSQNIEIGQKLDVQELPGHFAGEDVPWLLIPMRAC